MQNEVGNLENSRKWLSKSAIFCWSVVAAGQWIFVLYIIGVYWVSGAQGNYAVWNETLPHGHEPGNLVGNLAVGAHLFFAAVISGLGALQLVPSIRSYMPRFHRWSGRVYVVTAFIMALSGLYLILSGRKQVGGDVMNIAIFINAIIIISAATLALRFALVRNFVAHRRWALRLFWSVSGVWLFRVGLMCWLVIFQKPVGFDPETFAGPFLSVLAITVYILPIALLELYFRVGANGGVMSRGFLALGIFVMTLLMGLGIFGATMGLWIPKLFS